MELGLTGKVALVTGGSKGIGLACAELLLAEGARVAIVARGRAPLAAAAAYLRRQGYGDVTTLVADLGQAETAADLAATVERDVGPIDILINCAGAAQRCAPGELTSAAWQAAMSAKYLPYMHAIQAVAPRMIARQAGAIVNIVGIGGKVAMPTHLPGGAANAALLLATVGLAQEYGRHGVRVNAINPGATLTTRVSDALQVRAAAEGRSPAAVRTQEEAQIPLGRYGHPAEVARVAVFLASAQASYVTGALIPMAGGQYPVI